MTRTMALVVIAATLAACGGSGDDADSASAFVEQTLEQARKGQSGRRFDTLHPAQQAVVDRQMFVNCMQDSSFAVTDVHAVEEFDETVDIPEVGEVETTAVTVEYKLGDRDGAFTMHALQVNGKWTWFLQPDDLASFQSGECP